MPGRYDAVVCDLLSALLDSWALWRRVTGGEVEGRRWRVAYLQRVSAGEPYRPFLEVVAEAAVDVGLPETLAAELGRRWDELEPWPEVPDILARVEQPIAVVTNCSEELGRRAAARVGVELAVAHRLSGRAITSPTRRRTASHFGSSASRRSALSTWRVRPTTSTARPPPACPCSGTTARG